MSATSPEYDSAPALDASLRPGRDVLLSTGSAGADDPPAGVSPAHLEGGFAAAIAASVLRSTLDGAKRSIKLPRIWVVQDDEEQQITPWTRLFSRRPLGCQSRCRPLGERDGDDGADGRPHGNVNAPTTTANTICNDTAMPLTVSGETKHLVLAVERTGQRRHQALMTRWIELLEGDVDARRRGSVLVEIQPPAHRRPCCGRPDARSPARRPRRPGDRYQVVFVELAIQRWFPLVRSACSR